MTNLTLHKALRALLNAIDNGDDRFVALLLAEKPELLQAHRRDSFPLHLAASEGHGKIVAQLLAANPLLIDVVDDRGRTALHRAANGGFDQVMTQLLSVGAHLVNKVDVHEMTALHCAAQRGHEKVVAQLPNENITFVEGSEKNALHYAAKEGHDKVVALLLARSPELAGTVDPQSLTALHLAVQDGHERVAEMLLAIKPELIFMKDSSNNTVLHHAVECRVASRAFIARIYDLHPRALHAINKFSKTPFATASRSAKDFLQWKLCIDEMLPALTTFWDASVVLQIKSIVEQQCEVLLEYLNQDVVPIIHQYVSAFRTRKRHEISS